MHPDFLASSHHNANNSVDFVNVKLAIFTERHVYISNNKYSSESLLVRVGNEFVADLSELCVFLRFAFEQRL